MNPEKDIALFDSYLKGEMSSSEQKEFTQRLASDKEFSAAFEEHKLLMEAFRRQSRTELIAAVGAAHESLGKIRPDDYKPHNSRAWRNFFKNLFIYGALVCGGVLVYKYQDNIKELDKRLEMGTSEEKVIKIYVDTVYTSETVYDTVYKEIRISGDSEEFDRIMKEELDRIKKENPDADVDVHTEELELDDDQ